MDMQNIVEVLKKPPLRRTDEDISLLQKETQNIFFFKQYIDAGDADVHRKCCVKMQHQFLAKGKTVFNIDSVGLKFYLVIEGVVGVYIRLPKKTDSDDDLVCVKELPAGTGFGELALMNNKPRLASIICHSNCHFATLNKKEFTDILKQKEQDKLLREMGFFANLPFFSGWSINLIRTLYLNSVRTSFVKGDYVYKENSEPLAIFIIVSGEFVINKIFEKKEEEQPLQLSTKTQDTIHFAGNSKKQAKRLQICVYSNPELFGEEEIIEGSDSRVCSVVCNTARGDVIMISKKDFEQRIMTEEGAFGYLKLRLENKKEQFQKKLEMIMRSINSFSNFHYSDNNNNSKSELRIPRAFGRQDSQSQNEPQSIQTLRDILASDTSNLNNNAGLASPKKPSRIHLSSSNQLPPPQSVSPLPVIKIKDGSLMQSRNQSFPEIMLISDSKMQSMTQIQMGESEFRKSPSRIINNNSRTSFSQLPDSCLGSFSKLDQKLSTPVTPYQQINSSLHEDDIIDETAFPTEKSSPLQSTLLSRQKIRKSLQILTNNRLPEMLTSIECVADQNREITAKLFQKPFQQQSSPVKLTAKSIQLANEHSFEESLQRKRKQFMLQTDFLPLMSPQENQNKIEMKEPTQTIPEHHISEEQTVTIPPKKDKEQFSYGIIRVLSMGQGYQNYKSDNRNSKEHHPFGISERGISEIIQSHLRSLEKSSSHHSPVNPLSKSVNNSISSSLLIQQKNTTTATTSPLHSPKKRLFGSDQKQPLYKFELLHNKYNQKAVFPPEEKQKQSNNSNRLLFEENKSKGEMLLKNIFQSPIHSKSKLSMQISRNTTTIGQFGSLTHQSRKSLSQIYTSNFFDNRKQPSEENVILRKSSGPLLQTESPKKPVYKLQKNLSLILKPPQLQSTPKGIQTPKFIKLINSESITQNNNNNTFNLSLEQLPPRRVNSEYKPDSLARK